MEKRTVRVPIPQLTEDVDHITDQLQHHLDEEVSYSSSPESLKSYYVTLKDLLNKYTGKSRLLSQRLIEAGSLSDSQTVRKRRAHIHRECNEIFSSINACLRDQNECSISKPDLDISSVSSIEDEQLQSIARIHKWQLECAKAVSEPIITNDPHSTTKPISTLEPSNQISQVDSFNDGSTHACDLNLRMPSSALESHIHKPISIVNDSVANLSNALNRSNISVTPSVSHIASGRKLFTINESNDEYNYPLGSNVSFSMANVHQSSNPLSKRYVHFEHSLSKSETEPSTSFPVRVDLPLSAGKFASQPARQFSSFKSRTDNVVNVPYVEHTTQSSFEDLFSNYTVPNYCTTTLKAPTYATAQPTYSITQPISHLANTSHHVHTSQTSLSQASSMPYQYPHTYSNSLPITSNTSYVTPNKPNFNNNLFNQFGANNARPHIFQNGSQNNSLEVLSQHLLQQDLLKKTIEPFSGSAISFWPWLEKINCYIRDLTLSPLQTLQLLESHSTGEPKKLITHKLAATGEVNPNHVNDTIHSLIVRYGSSQRITTELFDRIDRFPLVKAPNIGDQLQDLCDLCNIIQYNMTKCPELRIMDLSTGLRTIRAKLPDHIQNEWRRWGQRFEDTNYGEHPPFKQFVDFLFQQARQLSNKNYETLHNYDKFKKTVKVLQTSVQEPVKEVPPAAISKDESFEKNITCQFHKSDKHLLSECKSFKKLPFPERKKTVFESRLCFRCLGRHRVSTCTLKVACDECGKNHVSAMHDPNYKPNAKTISVKDNTEQSPSQSEDKQVLCTKICGDSSARSCSKTLLVELTMDGVPHKKILAYCIVDEQSNSTLVDDQVVDFFGKEFPSQEYSLKFADQSCVHTSVGKIVSGLKVRGVKESEVIDIPEALSCQDIADTTNEVATPAMVLAHPHIAHHAKSFPEFNPDARVLLLIGRNVSRAMATKCLTQKQPYLHKGPLGYSLVGEACPEASSSAKDPRVVLKTSITPIDSIQVKYKFSPKTCKDTLSTFDRFQDDHLPDLSRDDRTFLDIMTTGVTVTEHGNLELPLPIKKGNLPDNKTVIYMRSKSTLFRLKSEPKKLDACLQSMQKNIDKGYVEQINKSTDGSTGTPQWFLPIFNVVHPRKKKIRMVYDAAARYKGISLNDRLYTGPDLNNQLRGVLLRFRERPIAFSADVQDMFNNFKVPEHQRSLLSFFWYDNNEPDKEIVPFRSTVHIFGCSSSPAVANFAMKHCASMEHGDEYETARDYLLHSFYVDDGISSADTPEEAVNTLARTRDILSRRNIRLHKITSNSLELLNNFPDSELATQENVLLSENSIHSTLGTLWNTSSDQLEIRIDIPSRPYTKRGVVSVTNSLYDPVGLICPIILTGRLLQREMLSNSDGTNSGLNDWDNPLPDSYKQSWDKWVASLKDIPKVTLDRSILPPNFDSTSQELHVFADSSEAAIGYVLYMRSINTNGNVHISFVSAASKVAPKGATSIPRLELCAAMEAAKCAASTVNDLKHKPDKVFLYSDSQIVLGYLTNTKRRFSKYISRRVDVILNIYDASDWFYVNTEENPADIATRPHFPEDLLSTFWLTGPHFLWSSSFLPNQTLSLDLDPLPEEKAEVSVLLTTHSVIDSPFTLICERHSDLNKVIRIMSYVKRFCNILLSRCMNHVVTEPTRDEVKMILAKDAQHSHLSSTIRCLKNGISIPENDKIAKLSPFLDREGILRVGGRLKQADISFNVKHPVLLPKAHPLSKLVIEDCHRQTRHQGSHISHGKVIQSGYHIEGGRQLIRSVINSCVLCKRLRATAPTQLMADLPPDRLEETPPFSNVGIDVFGPFHIQSGKTTRRTSSTKKVWALIFVCMPSRAIHLEPLPGMDTSTFRNALARFISIRGTCKLIRSDCGTNFIGARRQMEDINFETLSKELKQQEIEWSLNPPHASHFGGCWERKISSVRRILEASIALMGNKGLSYDEFTTLLAEASQIVNNTPMWTPSIDPQDPTPLSPAMLLTLREQPNPPSLDQYSEKDLLAYGPRRYRRVQYLSQQFWLRWRNEYIHTLSQRHKWKSRRPCVAVGDVVLLRDKQSSRNNWPMARVDSVKTSSDGLVRSVTLLMSSSKAGSKPRFLNRPISEIVLLVPHSSHNCLNNPA